MSEDLLSIVVPVYKVEAVLPRCLNSIIGQTHRNLEIILVDDGSPDRSGAVCDAYAARDSRIRVIHQANQGVSVARNRGAREARGHYLQFADSDDYLEPTLCSALLSGLTDDDVDLVICPIDNLTVKNGECLASERWFAPKSGLFDSSDVLRFIYNIANKQLNVLVMPFNKLYRRRLVEKHDIAFPPGMHPVEDCFFNLAYLDHCRRVSIIESGGYNYISDLSEDRLSAVQRYLPTELEIWTRYCRMFQEVMEKRLGQAELPLRNAGCASQLIAAVVRLCRRDASLGDAEIRAQLSALLANPEIQGYLADYTPSGSQSRLIPFLMKQRLIRPLLFVARRRADKRYGIFYGKTTPTKR